VPTQAPAHIADTCVGTQSPDDGAAVADFVIRCHESDLALSLVLAEDLAEQRVLVGLLPRRRLASMTVSKKPAPCSWSCRKTAEGYARGSYYIITPSRSTMHRSCRITARSWFSPVA
jgi:hypothetical protein